MKQSKADAIRASNKARFIKKFGTDNIKEILGEDVLTLKKSIHDRLLEFGDSHTSHWIKTYLPDDLKWLIPHQRKFGHKKSRDTLALSSESRKEEYLLKMFGTSDVEEILGEEVLNGTKAPTARFKELGKYTASHVYRFITTYASEETKRKLFPYIKEAEKLIEEDYAPERLEKLSEKSRARLLLSYARYGKSDCNSNTSEENREFLNSRGIEPLENVPVTARGTKFKAKCLICGKVGEFHFHSNNIPTLCPYCTNSGKTSIEIEIQRALEERGVKLIPKARGLIYSESGHPQEIDIYLPDLKIGFEINGALTHNSGITPFEGLPKSQDYHKQKTEAAASKGIKLYHIWEHWGDITTLKNLVFAKCRIFDKTYYARNLRVVFNPEEPLYKEFLERNHKQGFCRCSISVALLLNNAIIQFIGFTVSGDTADLVRNATEQGSQVLGGINRLFKHSVELLKSKGLKYIVTFADRDLTPLAEQSVYSRLGFSYVKDSGQTMSYYV